jgi:hypothetical protein
MRVPVVPAAAVLLALSCAEGVTSTGRGHDDDGGGGSSGGAGAGGAAGGGGGAASSTSTASGASSSSGAASTSVAATTGTGGMPCTYCMGTCQTITEDSACFVDCVGNQGAMGCIWNNPMCTCVF